MYHRLYDANVSLTQINNVNILKEEKKNLKELQKHLELSDIWSILVMLGSAHR
jgi:hypothetical protein